MNYMATFHQVAFDGSGTFGTHSAIAYGGIVATTSQWGAFTESWAAVLNREDLQYFKMAEAMKWYGEFLPKHSQWGTDRDIRRNTLLNELVTIALRCEFQPVGMFADARLFTQQNIASKKDELFQGALLALLRGVPDNHFVTLICDEEIDLEPKTRAWVRKLRSDQGSKMAPIVGVCFVDERAYPAVQLADMVAWLFRERGERIVASGDTSLHPLLERLKQDTHMDIHQTEVGKTLDGLRQYETKRSE